MWSFCLFSSYCVDFLLASLYLNRFTSLDNDDNDVEVALPLGGSWSAWFLVELEFGNVGFWGEGKTEVPGEKPLRAKERTNTSRHSWGSQVFTTSMRLFWILLSIWHDMGSLKRERIDSVLIISVLMIFPRKMELQKLSHI